MHGSLLYTGSQAWSKCDVTRLRAKRDVKVKSNTSMLQAILLRQHHICNNVMHFVITALHIARLVYCRIQWEKFRGSNNSAANCMLDSYFNHTTAVLASCQLGADLCTRSTVNSLIYSCKVRCFILIKKFPKSMRTITFFPILDF